MDNKWNIISRLNIPALSVPIYEHHVNLLLEFGKDLESTMKLYQKQKSDPPITRNSPPVAGELFIIFFIV